MFTKNKTNQNQKQISCNGLWKTTIFQPTCGKNFPQASGDFYYVTFFSEQFFHLMFFFFNFWTAVNGNKQNNKIGVKSHIQVV